MWPRNFDFARFLQTFALKLPITVITRISTAFGVGKVIGAAALIRVNTVLSFITMVLSSAFLEEKIISGANSHKLGKFNYAL